MLVALTWATLVSGFPTSHVISVEELQGQASIASPCTNKAQHSCNARDGCLYNALKRKCYRAGTSKMWSSDRCGSYKLAADCNVHPHCQFVTVKGTPKLCISKKLAGMLWILPTATPTAVPTPSPTAAPTSIPTPIPTLLPTPLRFCSARGVSIVGEPVAAGINKVRALFSTRPLHTRLCACPWRWLRACKQDCVVPDGPASGEAICSRFYQCKVPTHTCAGGPLGTHWVHLRMDMGAWVQRYGMGARAHGRMGAWEHGCMGTWQHVLGRSS